MPLGFVIPSLVKKYTHITGVPPYTDNFTGTAADLTAPWLQGKDLVANPTFGLQKNGSGAAKAGAGSGTICAACYNNTINANQYSQVVAKFNGPADDSNFILLFVRCNNHSGWQTAALGQPYYEFFTDGGSDSGIVYFDGSAAHTISTDSAFTFATNDILKFEIIGTQLKVYKNGIVDPTLSVSDANIASGVPGLGLSLTVTTNTVDDWEGGNATAVLSDHVDWKRKYDNSSIVANYTPDIVQLK